MFNRKKSHAGPAKKRDAVKRCSDALLYFLLYFLFVSLGASRQDIDENYRPRITLYLLLSGRLNCRSFHASFSLSLLLAREYSLLSWVSCVLVQERRRCLPRGPVSLAFLSSIYTHPLSLLIPFPSYHFLFTYCAFTQERDKNDCLRITLKLTHHLLPYSRSLIPPLCLRLTYESCIFLALV